MRRVRQAAVISRVKAFGEWAYWYSGIRIGAGRDIGVGCVARKNARYVKGDGEARRGNGAYRHGC